MAMLNNHFKHTTDFNACNKGILTVRGPGRPMREVMLVWDATTDPLGIFHGLTEVCSSIKVLCHLEIGESGVRQILEPEYQPGKGIDDVAALPYFDVESVFENNTLVVWNSHPLVKMATVAENIHILPPYELADGEVRITVRGLPETVGQFVRMCRQTLPPKHIKVQRMVESGDELEDRLTAQQFACFKSAAEHGYYQQKEGVTLQFLADLQGVSRSTLQEHLKSAERAILERTALGLINDA
jgi:hypothetical protein